MVNDSLYNWEYQTIVKQPTNKYIILSKIIHFFIASLKAKCLMYQTDVESGFGEVQYLVLTGEGGGRVEFIDLISNI